MSMGIFIALIMITGYFIILIIINKILNWFKIPESKIYLFWLTDNRKQQIKYYKRKQLK